MTFQRIIKAIVFISIHTLAALFFMSTNIPPWTIGCGIVGAAFATLLLILFAGDDKDAQLFFFENWQEVEKIESPVIPFIFAVVGCIWLLPVLCFFLTLFLLALRWLFDF